MHTAYKTRLESTTFWSLMVIKILINRPSTKFQIQVVVESQNILVPCKWRKKTEKNSPNCHGKWHDSEWAYATKVEYNTEIVTEEEKGELQCAIT